MNADGDISVTTLTLGFITVWQKNDICKVKQGSLYFVFWGSGRSN